MLSNGMGVEALPDELLLTLAEQWPCREAQIQQLAAVLAPDRANPSTVVVYGPPATGKSAVVEAYLQRSNAVHAIVRCRECVTGRHLLERTVAAVHQALVHEAESRGGAVPAPAYNGRCENLGVLVAQLQRLLEKRAASDSFVLVFDAVDVQREAPPTLLPALARLGEFIPNLVTTLIVRHPSSRFLHQAGVPHLHFSPYTRDQSIYILSREPLDIFPENPPEDLDYDDEVHAEDKAWLWPRFCAAVWDSLAQSAARDLSSYRAVCHRLWRPFLAPVVKGDFGTRDFSRLVVAQRRLFQDEAVLLHSIVEPTAATAATATRTGVRAHQLPYYAKWLLVAAYLASFNPARLDALYFMKSTERKRRKKGGGGARANQTRDKLPRHLLAASAFTIDRVLAILHAILPHDLRTTVDIYSQVATLAGLRLLTRSGGIGSSDPIEPGGRWRVGPLVTWEYALALARSLDFNMAAYVAE